MIGEGCDVCGHEDTNLMIDVRNITFRQGGKLPVRHCEACFTRLTGRSLEEWNAAVSTILMTNFDEMLEFCDFETGGFNTVLDVIEHYTPLGVFLGYSTG